MTSIAELIGSLPEYWSPEWDEKLKAGLAAHPEDPALQELQRSVELGKQALVAWPQFGRIPITPLTKRIVVCLFAEGKQDPACTVVHEDKQTQILRLAYRTMSVVQKKILQSKSHQKDIPPEYLLGRLVHHPGLIQVHAASPSGNEFIQEDLSEGTLLERSRSMTRLQVQKAFENVLEGLSYLHAHGIAHRDVKWENIGFRPDGQAVLFDLEFAARFGFERLIGTAIYLSPDSFMASAAQDMWALGILIYQGMTQEEYPWISAFPKKAAYSSRDYIQFILCSLKEHQAEWEAKIAEKGGLTGRLGTLMIRCLKYDPSLRPSAGEAFRLLKAS